MATYHLYFAYGSNLDEDQMLDRAPSAVRITTASLNGYDLCFSGWSSGWNGGVANVERRKGGKVRGVVWEIDTADLEYLDKCEGRPWQYDRKLLTVVARNGQRLKVWCYYMTARKPKNQPGMAYYAQIAAAYAVYGFSLRRLNAALLSAPARRRQRDRDLFEVIELKQSA